MIKYWDFQLLKRLKPVKITHIYTPKGLKA